MKTEDEHSGRLGDPMAQFSQENGGTPAPDEEPETLRREGDHGLGVPEFEPENERTLSHEETEAHRLRLEERMRQKAEAMLEDLEQQEGWRLPRSVRNGLSVFLIVIAALMGMFITAEIVQFFTTVSAMSAGPRWLATGAMILFGGILIVAFFGLLWGVFRLQRAPQLHLKAMKILSERRQLQIFAIQRQKDARTKLRRYLRDYPLSGKGQKRLTALGLREGELASLKLARDRLLDQSRPVGAEDWLDDFQKGFQVILDDLAQRRVKQYARRIAIGTAASPIPFVDQMIVLYGCIALVRDMSTIYQLRPAFGQTVLTLARSIVNTYLSGMLEDLTENAIDGLGSLEELVGDGLGILTGTVGKAVSAKAAEASLNALLIWRLGRRTIGLLQPVVTGRKQ